MSENGESWLTLSGLENVRVSLMYRLAELQIGGRDVGVRPELTAGDGTGGGGW